MTKEDDQNPCPEADVFDGVILIDSRSQISKLRSSEISQSAILDTVEPVCQEYYPQFQEDKPFTMDYFLECYEIKNRKLSERYFDPRNITKEEMVARYIDVLLQKWDKTKRSMDSLSKVMTLMTILRKSVEQTPDCLNKKQYKDIIDAITPTADDVTRYISQIEMLLQLPNERGDRFRKNVIGFCRAAMEVLPANETYWLHCIPMIHFLSGLKPFEVIHFDTKSTMFKSIEDIIEITAQKLSAVSPVAFWEKHKCFFAMDTLLPATLGACVPQRRLTTCFIGTDWASHDIVIASVTRHLNRASASNSQTEKNGVISDCIEVLLSQLENKKGKPEDLLSRVTEVIMIISPLLEENPKRLKAEQYKTCIHAITPPTDRQKQDDFSSKLTGLLEQQSSTDRDRLKKIIIGLCRASMEVLPTNETYWLHCIPMIHFLSGLKPFGDIAFDAKCPNWGDQQIEDIIVKTEQKLSAVRPVAFWEKHKCFFKMDTLLPATLVACVPQRRLTTCFIGTDWASHDIVIASVTRHLNRASASNSQSKKENSISDCIKVLLSQLENKKGKPEDLLSRVTEVIMIISPLLDENPKRLKAEQYKTCIHAITPPTDRQKQDDFSSKLTGLLEQQSRTDRDQLKEGVIGFCRASLEVLPANETYWLHCIPMIHFLSGLKPFEVIPFDAEIPNWGDKGIPHIIKETTRKLSVESHINFWDNHVCFFELDTLLPRTLAACVPQMWFGECFIGTNWVSPDIVIASVLRHLQMTIVLHEQSQFQTTLRELLIDVANNIYKANNSMQQSQNTAKQCRLVAQQLCEVLNQMNRHGEELVSSMFIVILAIQWEEQLLQQPGSIGSEMEKVKTIAKQLFQNCHGNMELLVKVTDSCLNPKGIHGSADKSNILTAWKEFVCDQFQCHVEKVKAISILDYYSNDVTGQHSSEVENILMNQLEQKIEEAFVKDQENEYWLEGSTFLKIYSGFLGQARETARHPLYKSALEYRILCPGLKMLVKCESLDLPEEDVEFLKKVRDTFTSLIKTILSGKISVKDLNFLRANQRPLQMFVKALDNDYSEVEEKMETSDEAIAKLRHTCRKLSCFLETNRIQIGDKKQIKQWILISENLKGMVCDLMKIQKQLSRTIENPEELDQISRCMKSASFLKIWMKTQSKANGHIPLKDLLTDVWKPSFEAWEAFGRLLKDRNITLKKIAADTNTTIHDRNKFLKHLQVDLAVLDAEITDLQLSKTTEAIISACNNVFDIQNISSVEICKSILRLKKSYKLTTKVSNIEAILKAQSGDIALSSVNEKTVKLNELLATFSSEILDCIESFIECQDVVTWIVEIMKDGQRDLTTFIDIALATAGESDLEIAMVRCFHSATLGYSRLIFMPANCTLTNVVKRLLDVQKALQIDPQLPQKLRETMTSLEKLKSNHKKQHEASDQKSLEQAKQIIKFGTCHVGADEKDGVIEMTLPQIIYIEVEQGDEVVKFQYETLEDIQNRLMLAGSSEDLKDPKAKDSMTKEQIIEKFTMIFDSLRRLGLVYIHLNELGCALFNKMKIVITGKETKSTKTCQIVLGGNDLLTVVREEHAKPDIIRDVKTLATLFDKCLDEWKEEIKQARETFYFLNHFTTKQLILIQKGKSSPCSKEEGNKLQSLLSLAIPGCTIEQMTKIVGKISDNKKEKKTTKGTVFKLWDMVRKTDTKMKDFTWEPNNMEHMCQVFNIVWNSFVDKYTKAPVSSDFLSFRGLGNMLHELIKILPKKGRLDRCLPEPLKKDEPNLIVCPTRLIINATLSVYLLDKTKQKPLPRPEEVLLCTSETTIDEVEAFLRRSLQEHPRKERKIYTMMYADQLSVEVACEAETILKKLQTQNKRGFQLVIVSSKENENKSVMTAALEKYHRHFPESAVEAIKDYTTRELGNTVECVTSKRAGEGKTLYKNKRFQSATQQSCTIPMHDRVVDREQMMSALQNYTTTTGRQLHIDIAHVVQSGVDYVLFQLLIVGCLASRSGEVWLKSRDDLFLVECLESSIIQTVGKATVVHTALSILPTKYCISPGEWLAIAREGVVKGDKIGFCENEFRSDMFQVPYDHLRILSEEISMTNCIDTLLRHCGVQNPSWVELKHFASFLNVQIRAFKDSVFCNAVLLPGFPDFVKSCLIQMSQDFATRSLDMSEESDGHIEQQNMRNDLQGFQMKRKWETSPHPYLFFNKDGDTFTFLGFNLQKKDNGSHDLVDDQTGIVLKEDIMNKELFDILIIQGVPLSEKIEHLTRRKCLEKLAFVMGLSNVKDPDTSYELNSDNMKKILAVFMRFRCSIPVIIMGETGCGKTSLVKFMCQLQCQDDDVRNMILMKVHGGTTKKDIMDTVKEADRIARQNLKTYGSAFFTVLFFDEANTTEAIHFIKEIICDNTMNGKKLDLSPNLKFIAACNPYRKHSEDMIERLERAGLGYHVKESTDTLGHIPMRHLVYRVQSLPEGMLPLVWDFGQLNLKMEKQYIKQMVAKQVPFFGQNQSSIHIRRKRDLSASNKVDNDVASILLESQSYMRNQKDECSFVSLRDVQRTLQVMSWFLKQEDLLNTVEEKMKNYDYVNILPKTRSLVLALGVCYLSALKDKDKYTKFISAKFSGHCKLPGGAKRFEREIQLCQEVILENSTIGPNIARNQALSENVFLMTVCIELRIPLFLVGKPGSSKSLAKAILTDTMQGASSRFPLFRKFKQAQMMSYQCSQLSTSDGIIRTFNQAAGLQKTQDLEGFVSVVVLDEIGLAEDSPRMPLKALHPLLEDGTDKDSLLENTQAYKKVSFIGISNWALDPAKMNRGILVQRDVPSEEELIDSARGICDTDTTVQKHVDKYLLPVAKAYIELLETTEKDFFGLRDFYGLIKMMYAFIATSKKQLTHAEFKHSILRNFGGLDGVDALEIFLSHLRISDTQPSVSDPDCSQLGLIKAALSFKTAVDGLENRYLLLLTENYSFLPMLQQQIRTIKNLHLFPLFGSSFPKDQEYTQICRNINRIKLCMESGQAVLLLNLENLYESLYDVLNQYYVRYAGEQYVDLGLGTNRMKCMVHPNFRLILVAEKQTVYETFPVPLINRLEKHLVRGEMLLTAEQVAVSNNLDEWMLKFIKHNPYYDLTRASVFIGYSSDMAPLVALKVWGETVKGDRPPTTAQKKHILNECKKTLLKTCTPDGILRHEDQTTENEYFSGMHDSVVCLLDHIKITEMTSDTFRQVTTFSRLLPAAVREDICKQFQLQDFQVELLNAMAFDTDQEFCKKIREFVSPLGSGTNQKILIVQCESGDKNSNLIACVRNRIEDVVQDPTIKREFTLCVLLIIQLPNTINGCFTGFQSGQWTSIHIDDVNEETRKRDLRKICRMTYTDLIQDSANCQQHETTIDISQVLKNCICLAMAKIRGPDHKMSKRGLTRISHLMDLILTPNVEKTNEDTLTFVNGIVKVILRLQSQKEESLAGFESNGKSPLIARNACNPENVRQAGTFRRSVTRCIEMEISTSLAYAIAFLDTNQNLDLLQCSNNLDKNVSWKEIFFLKVLNNDENMIMQYKTMQKTLKSDEKGSKFVVEKTTGYDDQPFQARLPFSWIIYSNIDRIYRSIDKKEFSPAEVAKNVFTTLPVVNDLNESVSSTAERKEATNLYLKDFLHMTFSIDTDTVGKILETTFLQAGVEIGFPIDDDEMSEGLVNIHHIKTVFSRRLENFQMLRKVWPECDAYVKERVDSQKTEVSLDVLALRCTVDGIRDGFESCDKTRWLSSIEKCGLLITSILKDDGHITYGTACKTMLTSIRNEWGRLLVLKMFCEEVVLKTKIKFDISKVLDSLKMCSLKKISGLDNLDEFIRECKKASAKSPRDGETRETFERYMDNFYMRVVAQLYFENNSPPPDEVIEKLLTHLTSGLSETVDESRAVEKSIAKSSLLKILLRSRGTRVKKHLKSVFCKEELQWINKFEKGASRPLPIYLLEFCSMVIRCIVDSYRSELAGNNSSFTEAVTEALKKLNWANQQQFKPGLHYDNLEIIARIQFGLKITATCLQKCFVEKNKDCSNQVNGLLSKARTVCTQKGMTFPYKYLIREMCDMYGMSSYLTLVRNLANMDRDLHWIAAITNSEHPECEHCYCVCGPDYVKVRDELRTAIEQIVNSEISSKPPHDLQVQRQTIYLTLALHREVTFSYLQGRTLYQPNILARIEEVYQGAATQAFMKHHIWGLVNNKIGENMTYLNLREGLDLQHQGIICLLEHMYVLCMVFKDSDSLLFPLIQIALKPENMERAYLPTMPQEEYLEDVLAILRESNKTAQLYVCPNGHPYGIGDCGNPWVEGKCDVCQLPIGGKWHSLKKDNRKVTSSDMENDRKKNEGHILGDPLSQPTSGAERNLTPVSTAMLRLFTHAVLILGANINQKAVMSMIKPTIKTTNLQNFLVKHMKRDLNFLQHSLDRSCDDSLLLCHYTLDVIMRGCLDGSLNSKETHLSSLEARKKWETNIQRLVLTNIGKETETILKECRKNMKGETGSQTQLIAFLETDKDSLPTFEKIQENSILWRHHARVSIEGFIAEVLSSRPSVTQDNQTLLGYFISKLEIIQLVKHLPDILNLQRTLLHMSMRRKMVRRDANVTSMKQFIAAIRNDLDGSKIELKRIERQVEVCIKVWENINKYLKNYVLVVYIKGFPVRRVVPPVIQKSHMSFASPVEMFLPSFDEQGLCAFVLVEFLIRTQNELLQEYCRFSKFRFEDVPIVLPKHVSHVNVISLDKHVHLLPLILSNCKYEVDAERGQCFEYDMEGIERQVKDQFICGRSRIDIKSIPTMMYWSEKTEAWSFRQVTEVVPQVPMTETLKKKVLDDFQSLPQLYQALNNLDMTISLLCCLPEQINNQDRSLFDFMTKTMQMSDTGLGQQVEHSCRFKHVLSLWLVLSMKKDNLLLQNHQDTFQCLEMKFKSGRLDGNMMKKYQGYFNDLTKAEQRQLIETLYECMVITYTSDASPDYSSISVLDTLSTHASTPIYDETQLRNAGITLLEENGKVIKNFPPEIQGTMAVSAWGVAMEWFQSDK